MKDAKPSWKGRGWVVRQTMMREPRELDLLLVGVTQKLSLQGLNSQLHLLSSKPLPHHLFQEVFPGCCGQSRHWCETTDWE